MPDVRTFAILGHARGWLERTPRRLWWRPRRWRVNARLDEAKDAEVEPSETLAATAPTKDRINQAAIELFYRQGYNATSLRQIADSVGLQVGSLYNHISSKEELLWRIMSDVMLELIEFTEEQLAAVGDQPVDRLNTFLRSSVHFHAIRRKETFIGNSELRGLSEEHLAEVMALRDRYEEILRSTIEAAQERGQIDVDDLHLATFAALAMCTSVARWFRLDGRLSLADVEEQLPRLFGPIATASIKGSARP